MCFLFESWVNFKFGVNCIFFLKIYAFFENSCIHSVLHDLQVVLGKPSCLILMFSCFVFFVVYQMHFSFVSIHALKISKFGVLHVFFASKIFQKYVLDVHHDLQSVLGVHLDIHSVLACIIGFDPKICMFWVIFMFFSLIIKNSKIKKYLFLFSLKISKIWVDLVKKF